MSEERPFRRVVILCDATCDIRLAVTEATALAARFGVGVHGIFLDDENLRRLADLPFGQPVSLSSASFTEEFSAETAATLSAALGAAMRRTLAETAAAAGLPWTFGSMRDLPAAAALVAETGDILLVEGEMRPFLGTWRPRSMWEASAGAFPGTTLIRGRRHGGKGIAIVLPEDAEARDKLLEVSAALAPEGEDILIVGDDARHEDILEPFAPEQRSRIKRLPGAPEELARSIAAVRPRLVALVAEEVEPETLAELLARSGCDFLLVR